MKNFYLICLLFLCSCGIQKEKITGYKPGGLLPPAVADSPAGPVAQLLRCHAQLKRDMNLREIALASLEMQADCGLSDDEILTLGQQVFH